MKVRFSSRATRDLRAISNWIAADRPNTARKIVRNLRSACLSLADRPNAYALVQGREDDGMRRAPHGRYLIFYHVEADTVAILRILDSARDVTALL